MHNIQIICPAFAKILINTYREPTRSIISGGKELLSNEGTTQGDNLAMSFYGLSTVPLQNTLRLPAPNVSQVWLADDATGAGTLKNLKFWWDTVINDGAKLGCLSMSPNLGLY